MKKVVVGCLGARLVAGKIARKLKTEYSELAVKKFPDNEINIRFLKEVKNKEVILVQSFYDNLNEKIIETLFAAYTAKDLGARKVILLALYFPYFRKDKRFKSGECISIEVISKLFRIFNKIFVVEPHLHRIKNLKKILSNGKRIDISNEIATYIRKLKLKNSLIMGPDIESFQWAKHVAKILKLKCVILRKKRSAARKVKIKLAKRINLKDKGVVIIDDIISTGHTMLETIKEIKKYKPRKVYCIGIHGIFAENALPKLKKYSTVISTNTIPSKVAKIDVSNIIDKYIK